MGIHNLLEILLRICCGMLIKLTHMNWILLLWLFMEWNPLTHNIVTSNNEVLWLDHWRTAPVHVIPSYFVIDFVFDFVFYCLWLSLTLSLTLSVPFTIIYVMLLLILAKHKKQTIQPDSRYSTKLSVCELSHDTHYQHMERNERPLLYLDACICRMHSRDSYKSNLSN